ncbi:MAG TPA: MFS transporter [Vicinamibacteria bacterium]|nr:MFS transporter [Vicinamibacteria bacterium]
MGLEGTLRALGLHRRELRSWAMYDWANSAFVTTVMGTVLPIYYVTVAGSTLAAEDRTAYWGYTQSVALVVVALTSPVLGAAADFLGAKKKFLAFFAFIGSLGTFLLYFAGDGEWFFASSAFILGNIGFASGNVFYESLLPHVAGDDEIDRVSTAGYALGYVGGGLLLAVHLAWLSWPTRFGFTDPSEASRWAFLSVAVWWVLFTIPILRGVPEPTRVDRSSVNSENALRVGVTRVVETLSEIRRYRDLFVFLLAFWFYNDGINTIIKMATAYGTEIGIGAGHLVGSFLLAQFVGIPATFAFGTLASRIGAKNAIYLSLFVYTGISVLGFFMTEAWQFWTLAGLLALVQGGSQALSRSLFATMVPPSKSSQFFGFFSVSSKFGNIVGPFVFAVVADWTGGGRLGILALIVFFAIGLALLTTVDVQKGRTVALAVEASLVPPAVAARLE